MTLVLEGSAGIAILYSAARVYCKSCVDFCGCGPGRTALQRAKARLAALTVSSEDREAFEELIGFLSAVPLFQRQLPKHELPMVARAFKREEWLPSQKVVEQGREGKAFYVVQSGKAKVVVTDSKGEQSTRAELYHRDYFGGHTLTAKRPNVATIVATGDEPLVTLKITREDFEKLGLHQKFVFPARPAIYEGQEIADGKRTATTDARNVRSTNYKDRPPLTEAEVTDLVAAISNNANLLARAKINESQVKEMAKHATVQNVPKGTEMLRTGDKAKEYFYVISEGSFDVFYRGDQAEHQSLEAFLVSSDVSASMGNKEQFLLHMAAKGMADKKKSMSEKKNSAHYQEPLPSPSKRHGSVGAFAWSGFKGGSERAPAPAQPKAKPRARASMMTVGAFNKGRSVLMGGAYDRQGSGRGETENAFEVGAQVSCVMAGGADLVKAVGEVVEVLGPGKKAEVVVQFPSPHGRKTVKAFSLRPVEEDKSLASLKQGDTFGELAILYNTRQVATVVASEDSVVFALPKSSLMEHFGREREKKLIDKYWALLNEVHTLSPLLLAERLELARSSRGFTTWAAGEKVLRQGEPLMEQLWYVIAEGTAIVTQQIDKREEETILGRKQHFGNKCVSGTETESEMSVTAGPNGLTCLTITGELLSNFVSTDDDGQLVEYERSSFKMAITPLLPSNVNDMMVTGLLGKGGFGSVFLGTCEGKEYALKRLSKGYIVDQGMIKQLCIERDILSMVDSPFIIKFYRSYKDSQYVYMLLELATGGHLYKIIATMPGVLYPKHKPLGSIPMFYVACVASALEHLHDRNIAYRDLKPENVLLDGKGYAKVCDLGFAIFMLGRSNTIVGTPQYMAPEMIDAPHTHTKQVDWWSLGVLTFELLALQVPWDDQDAQTPMAALFAIRRGQDAGVPVHNLPKWTDLFMRDFVKQLLNVDEEKRLGFRGGQEVKKHVWFTYSKFDFKALENYKLPGPYSQMSKVVEETFPKPIRLGEYPPEPELYEEYKNDGANEGWDKDF
mmetsp:Transcript_22241/g.50765  ORF Transcript_22241/g.50765 Transcript_22241/m.50765 type:complete len:1015 (+) Transcript_22241:117-3161(+)